MDKKVVIIAEVGECWNGRIEEAEALIKAAAESGCDYVKFQTLDRETIRDDDPEKDWFLKIALTEDTIGLFIKCAAKNNIRILFTPANAKKARLLKEKFGLNEVKVASSVFYDKKAIEYIADVYQRIFLSTGMSSLEEIKERIMPFEAQNKELYLLHCISEYPTGPLLEARGLVPLAEEDVHMNMMLILKKSFPGHKVGYSDHTAGLLAPLCAVAAGADIIEKHITLDRSRPIQLYRNDTGYLGTDHILSLEPPELKKMVSQIRQIEKIFGEYKWERTKGEKVLKDFLIGRF